MVVAGVQRGEGAVEICRLGLLELDPSCQTIGPEAPVNLFEDLESLVQQPSAVKDPGQLNGSVGPPWLERQCGAKRLFIALLSQQFRVSPASQST